MRRTARAVAVALSLCVPMGLVGVLVTPARAAPQQKCAKSIVSASHNPWNDKMINAEDVWNMTKGGGVPVAVVDSGIDKNNPLLNGFVGKPTSVVGGNPYEDCIGHGTLVAGLIAADKPSNGQFNGVAPEARLISIKLTKSGETPGGTGALAEAIIEAVRRGARVINVSITSSANDPELKRAVKIAVSNNVVVVAASGNDDLRGGATQDVDRYYPAGYADIPGVLAVAAIGKDGKATKASHAGAYVDVAAPGGKKIVSTGPNGPKTLAAKPQGGTSFAAPYVAGTAALVRAYRPNLTAAQVAERIKTSADPAPEGAGLGAGVVNPYAAVTMELPGEAATAAPPPPQPQYAQPPDPTEEVDLTRVAALSVASGGILLILVVIGLGVAIPRGQRRGWRAGHKALPQVEETPEKEEAPLPRSALGVPGE